MGGRGIKELGSRELGKGKVKLLGMFVSKLLSHMPFGHTKALIASGKTAALRDDG